MANEPIQQDSAILLELMLRQFGGDDVASASAPQLMAAGRELFFRKSEALFRAGEPARRIYFVVEGSVRLEHDNDAPWHIDAPGIVGLLDAELERPHARTALAVVDTHTFAASVDDYVDVVQANFALVTTRMKRVALMLQQMGAADGHSALLGEPSSVARCRPDPDSGVCVPGVMDRAMNPFERLLMLRLCPLFQRTRMQALTRLAGLSREHTVATGERLYQAGQTCSDLYLLVHGQVELVDDKGYPIGRFGPPEPLGGYLALGLAHYPYDAVARTPARLLVLRIDDLYDVMEDHFDAAKAVTAFMLVWIERLRERLGGALSADSG